ncbi:MAG: DNA polymerase I, partial [Chlamydiia bacterium]|nr:DNA polymerase I [Chlamydiia bacterium]
HTLDHLVFHHFDYQLPPLKNLIGSGKKEIPLAQVPIPSLAMYGCQEVDYVFRLKGILEQELRHRKLENLLVDLELPLTRILFQMECTGMFVDAECLARSGEKIVRDLTRAEGEIYSLAGEKFNITSPKQLSVILFEKLGIKPLKKTSTGLSTRADVLEALAEEYPIAQKILEFRTLEKLRSTYIEALPLAINPHTHRIHPTFSQYATATGRLACQDPNLQNIPVRTPEGKRIREAFRPEKEGWSYLAADYSQVELRLLAHLSEDPQLIQAFQEGGDIHSFTASLVFGIPLEKITPLERHRAKAINFGIIYGQQAYGLSQELGISTKEAERFIEAYFERYPRVLAFVNECIERVRREGKGVTMLGREREIPEIYNTNALIRHAAERLAVNTPLQGSAADLIKQAMLEIDRVLKQERLEAKMILQIHDELIFEAPDHELDSLKILVK